MTDAGATGSCRGGVSVVILWGVYPGLASAPVTGRLSKSRRRSAPAHTWSPTEVMLLSRRPQALPTGAWPARDRPGR